MLPQLSPSGLAVGTDLLLILFLFSPPADSRHLLLLLPRQSFWHESPSLSNLPLLNYLKPDHVKFEGEHISQVFDLASVNSRVSVSHTLKPHVAWVQVLNPASDSGGRKSEPLSVCSNLRLSSLHFFF